MNKIGLVKQESVGLCCLGLAQIEKAIEAEGGATGAHETLVPRVIAKEMESGVTSEKVLG